MMNANKTLILQNLLGRLETAAPDVVSKKNIDLCRFWDN